ncbi:hypothetical protein AM228_07190 [Planktothricoides sp. SR001]|uniref:hypothetical protein n=1 Tax=Planktothricoides sp. SR001 TaxID=1705388 RepID=UPI0006C22650|nr:hypothetical protein [Planktothricoides sp. SR001]KOR37421.1 hypothetical protein AM228_07190 [Planktothricoides sp. SR001]
MSKSGLILVAIMLGLFGGLATYKAGKVVCMINDCLVITEGEGWNARGYKIDPGQAMLIQKSPMILFGLGGAFLIAGLVKSDNKPE